ncbi:uncharacterized protein [Physcomitrium patens]|uniref:uncharacterized protein isoform X1 n=2 Tax=Physcomitrium patens TaxID=3218 RepID=UPI003CCCDD60
MTTRLGVLQQADLQTREFCDYFIHCCSPSFMMYVFKPTHWVLSDRTLTDQSSVGQQQPRNHMTVCGKKHRSSNSSCRLSVRCANALLEPIHGFYRITTTFSYVKVDWRKFQMEICTVAVGVPR